MGGRLLVVERNLTDVLETPPPAGVSIERFATDWEALTAIAGSRRCARFHEAAARGRVCFIARREGRPIGYAWLAERLDPELDSVGLALPTGTARLSDLYVVPPERNAGVGSALVCARMSYAREHGFVRTWQTVAPGNRASRRVIEKTGCVPARVVAEVRILPLLRWRRLRLLPAEAGEAPPHKQVAKPRHLAGLSD
jgi:GNAT superfamily N-acetyltransferase